MGSEQDDVLSLNEDGDDAAEFSGFSPLRTDGENNRPRPAVHKKKKSESVLVKIPKPSTRSARNKSSKTLSKTVPNKENCQPQASTSAASDSVFDISKLSETDIVKLREALGINPQNVQYEDDDDITSMFGQSLENMPNLHVQLDSADISDGENPRGGLG